MMKGDFPVGEFAERKTPFYFYDLPLLERTLDAVRSELKGRPLWKVHYAVKANANPEILRRIAAAGLGADCVSGGEVRMAYEAGFDPSGIVYAGVGKSDDEIAYALELGIARFNVESSAELLVIEEIAAKMGKVARISLRVNPDIGAHTHATSRSAGKRCDRVSTNSRCPLGIRKDSPSRITSSLKSSRFQGRPVRPKPLNSHSRDSPGPRPPT